MKLLFGTSNPTKLAYVKEILRDLPLELVSATDIGMTLMVDEDGDTPETNARKKAAGYLRSTGMCSLAIDSGLYIDGLLPDRQPGCDLSATAADKAMRNRSRSVSRG